MNVVVHVVVVDVIGVVVVLVVIVVDVFGLLVVAMVVVVVVVAVVMVDAVVDLCFLSKSQTIRSGLNTVETGQDITTALYLLWLSL